MIFLCQPFFYDLVFIFLMLTISNNDVIMYKNDMR